MAIILSCDVPKLFELVETAFDKIALFVLLLAVIDEVASVAFGGMTGLDLCR